MKILIAEDNVEHRWLLSWVFQGDEIVEARDGEEAIAKAIECHPDIVLMDVQLPKIDGFEALRWLKADESTARIPVVLMSAIVQAGDIKRGTELGAVDFLQKPFEVDMLEAKVKQWAGEE